MNFFRYDKKSEEQINHHNEKVFTFIESFISDIPSTNESASTDPITRSKAIAKSASTKAALVSGGLALPVGPFGLLTIIPDLAAIWKIQSQMIADIAATFNKSASLTREQMLYCLFKHAASQAVRDLVIRVGERVLVRRASLKTIQQVINKVGIKVTQQVAAKTISRWIPGIRRL